MYGLTIYLSQSRIYLSNYVSGSSIYTTSVSVSGMKPSVVLSQLYSSFTYRMKLSHHSSLWPIVAVEYQPSYFRCGLIKVERYYIESKVFLLIGMVDGNVVIPWEMFL
jgi:hypothetical protein